MYVLGHRAVWHPRPIAERPTWALDAHLVNCLSSRVLRSSLAGRLGCDWLGFSVTSERTGTILT